MEIKSHEISTFILYIIFSIALGVLISDKAADSFLNFLPTIIGILLGGVLSSLAIIFGLLSSDDLKLISETKTNNGKDIYLKFISSTRLDAQIIICSLFFSIIILLIKDTTIPYINTIPLKVLFIPNIFLLFLTMSATYDIVISLFHLNELRYTIAANKKN